MLGVQHLVADDVRVRADETDLRVQALLKHVLDERGDGGLAVRAGHTDHGQLTRRVIEKFAADARERKAAVGHEDIRYLDLWLSLAEHDGRTFTSVTPLDFEGRKAELARIIGGASITPTTLQSAAEMLESRT